MRGGRKFRFFNYRRIEWNFVIFCEKVWISPISNYFNVNFDFQKWFTCWEDFRNFEENFFCFPHSTPTCKIGHDYLLKKWYFLKSFFQNVDHFSPYLTSKYISKSNCVLHVGKFYKKNHFFGSRFFKFHRHVIHFLCKKRAKKKVTCCDFHQKIFRKKWKKQEIFFKFSRHVTQKINIFKKFLHMGDFEKNDTIFWKVSFQMFCKQFYQILHCKYESDDSHHCKYLPIFISFTIDNLVDNILDCCMFCH